MHKRTIIAAQAFIVDDDRILLGKRANDDTFLPGYWEQFGGKVEWGEAPEDTVVREAKEECGLDVTVRRLLGIYTANDQEGRHMIEIGYYCEPVGASDVVLSHEHSEFLWVPKNKLKTVTPMSDHQRRSIKASFQAFILSS